MTTLAGTAGVAGADDGTGEGAGFFYPFDVAVDSAGILYVADTLSDTIRMGALLTAAGPDFNGDGNIDILWRNTISNEIGTWLMNGTTSLGYVNLASEAGGWQVINN